MAKPIVRVAAGDSIGASARQIPTRTADSFVNFSARLGIGAGNLMDSGGYDFNFITRQRTGLEAAYRGSWVVGAAVDHAAEDMTTAGITLATTMDPDQVDEVGAAMRDLQIGERMSSACKWGRLYGGAIALIMIDGQDMASPLDLETVKEGAFKGLYVLDRWMLNPVMSDLIQDLGPDLGMPEYYTVVAANQLGIPAWKLHHTRCLRFDGVELPYQQKVQENLWSMSVIERIFDRLQAFDSTTAGAAQLVFKAYLRNWKIPQLRDLIATGGVALEALMKQVDFVRMFQSSEGITLLDGEDEFEALTYTFTGLDQVMLQFGQQLAGAIEEPMVRLFGQSPAGLNSTGEADLRTYYDNIRKRQEKQMRRPYTVVLDVLSRSIFGKKPPKGFTFEFTPLWQMTAEQKSKIANEGTQAIVGAYDAGITDRATALKELKALAPVTGMWSNVDDKAIKEAEEDPPIGEQMEAEMNPPQPAPGEGGNVKPIKAAA